MPAARAPARPARSEGGVQREIRYGRATVALALPGSRPTSTAASRACSATARWVSVRAGEGRAGVRARPSRAARARRTGTLTVDGATLEVDGFGLRDRSWGPRYWQAPDHYRWLTMNFGADAGIAAAAHRAARRPRACRRLRLRARASRTAHIAQRRGRDRVRRRRAAARARSRRGSRSRRRRAGRARRRAACCAWCRCATGANGVTTRIAEGLTEWRWGDRVGYGWSEYLDHVAELAATGCVAYLRARLAPTDVDVDGLARLPGGASRESWLVRVRARRAASERLVLRRDPPGHVDPVEPAAASSRCSRRRPRRGRAGAARALVRGRPGASRLAVLRHGLRRGRDDRAPPPARRRVRGGARRAARAARRARSRASTRSTARAGAGVPRAAARPARSPAQVELDALRATSYARIAPDPHPALELAVPLARARASRGRRRRAVVHGDFRIGNVIFGPEGLRAVLDWELSHTGDPMEDLGWLCVRSWRFGNDDQPVGRPLRRASASSPPTSRPAARASIRPPSAGGRCSAT